MSGNGVHGSGDPADELNELLEGAPRAADEEEAVDARPEEAPIAGNVAIGGGAAGAAEVAAGGAEAAEDLEAELDGLMELGDEGEVGGAAAGEVAQAAIAENDAIGEPFDIYIDLEFAAQLDAASARPPP